MFVVGALIAGVIRGFSGMVTAALSWIPGGIGRTIAGISTHRTLRRQLR